MKIAVVTAYYKEPLDILKRCHDSVMNQTAKKDHEIDHYMVADGHAADLSNWNIQHIQLPASHSDFGDTPRAIGSASAVAKGYDAILYLDADNYYTLDHIEKLVALQQSGNYDVVTATRNICDMDNNYLGVCSESNGENFNDTNCYMIMKRAFALTAHWGFKESKEGPVGDRIFWNAVKQSGARRIHCSEPTVFYVSTLAFHYQMFGLEPPMNSKVIAKVSGSDVFKVFTYEEILKLRSQ